MAKQSPFQQVHYAVQCLPAIEDDNDRLNRVREVAAQHGWRLMPYLLEAGNAAKGHKPIYQRPPRE